MTRLSVNVNKIALLRNQREVGYPDPLRAARTVLQAGAHGITVHPRPDERHIRPQDVVNLASMMRKEYADKELNVEGNPHRPSFMALCEKVRPHQVTLVPDAPDAHTSDHGWNMDEDKERLFPLVASFKRMGCRVSLFMDPLHAHRAATVGAECVEFYTGPFAHTFRQPHALEPYLEGADKARSSSLFLHAGHDLTLDTLPLIKKGIPDLAEVSIGHGFVADALWLGLERTVRAYLQCL